MNLQEDSMVFVDDWIILVNKDAGIPSVPDKSQDLSVLEELETAFGQTLFAINRIDRPTSGLMLISRSKKSAAVFSSLFKEKAIKKTYLAFVQGQITPDKNTLEHYMIRDGRNSKSRIIADKSKGQKAILKYDLLGKSDHYSLLKLELKTGRFHQIRAQLSHIDYPIKGDVKYGARRANKNRSIHLHAWKIDFLHPGTSEKHNIIAPLPSDPLWDWAKKIV